MINQHKRHNQSGVSLILGTAALVFIIPAVGLAIDVGYVYAIKAKLQAAVDGAALAAARGLSLGQTTTAQAASAKQKAVNWFYANLPANDWMTKNTQMDTTDTHVHVFDDPNNPQVRNVTVTASTSAPTFFMRWFGMDATLVSVTSNASRRDVVAMMVLDQLRFHGIGLHLPDRRRQAIHRTVCTRPRSNRPDYF